MAPPFRIGGSGSLRLGSCSPQDRAAPGIDPAFRVAGSPPPTLATAPGSGRAVSRPNTDELHERIPAPHALGGLATPAELGEVVDAASRLSAPSRQLRGLPGVRGPGDRPAVPRSGGGRRLAGLARAALARPAGRRGGGPRLAPTLLQRLAHPRQLQVAVVLLGDIELLRRAVRVADRQLIGLARGDLGLVEVRNIHRDRLGAHRDSLLGRSEMKPIRRHFGQRYPEQRGATSPLLPKRYRAYLPPIPAP